MKNLRFELGDSPQIAFPWNDGEAMNWMRVGREETDDGVSGLVPRRHFIGKCIGKSFLSNGKIAEPTLDNFARLLWLGKLKQIDQAYFV